jgi:predicted hydrocarbon binding protein/KaiC/GvpD/RAD55 family RecA-like ATPase
MSLAKLQEPLDKGLILLAGAPGAGKSTFCQQVVVNSITTDRPVIFVTSERSPADIIELLSERGVGERVALNFVDAFTETVGLTSTQREDTVYANCADLNSLSIAITRLQERTGIKGSLLAFDSLTSPYLFNGVEVVKFIRLFLSRFAAEGNSVLALMDEGCGKEEDLAAMMSVANGILTMEIKDSSRIINVVKHPKVTPTRIEVPAEPTRVKLVQRVEYLDPVITKKWSGIMARQLDTPLLRREVGDFVNLFWANLAHWSGMLWDPKRFPTVTYELNKDDPRSALKDRGELFPWYVRLVFKLFLPRHLNTVKDIKHAMKFGLTYSRTAYWERSGIVKYLDDISGPDEHYFRVYESSDCWGLENAGVVLASHIPALSAGTCEGCEGLDREGREWNAIETKCIGLGDPYCEFKLVPGEITGLRSSLEKDSATIERIHERLIERLIEFLLHEKPLVERPRLGSHVHVHAAWHAMGVHPPAGERYGMALRMGGARSGKKVGERLMDAGLSGDEAIQRVVHFLEHCDVGKVTLGETIKIKENCESSYTGLFRAERREPSCFFTTGFLNGLFSVVKNKRVHEIKCLAAGDPYCEWEVT